MLSSISCLVQCARGQEYMHHDALQGGKAEKALSHGDHCGDHAAMAAEI